MMCKLASMDTLQSLRNQILSWKVKGDPLQRIPAPSPSFPWSLESLCGADYPASTAGSQDKSGRRQGKDPKGDAELRVH